MRSLDDSPNIVASTSHWFVLGRAHLALEGFQEGQSAHGVLAAMKEFPDTFRLLFCYTLEVVTTAESLEGLFTVKTSPVGSTKAVTESLVLSRWSDYLQDIEDSQDSIDLSDILFFATGCRTLDPVRYPLPSNSYMSQENLGTPGSLKRTRVLPPCAYL